MGTQSYQNEQIGRGSTNQSNRHLIALIDGTWVSASRKGGEDKYSNIYKIGLYIETQNDANEPQIAFYLAGLGSRTSGLHYSNGILAVQLPLEVEKAYINLCANYSGSSNEIECDKIYLFGFSRGAVIARLVAALINKYGLLNPSQIEMFSYIWNDYIKKRAIPDLKEFKDTYCSGDVKIEFMGLFDTVYGMYFGSDRGNLSKVFFGDRLLGNNVKTAVHILARDETRRDFRPILFEGKNPEQILEQIWMPGVHTDIGGGYIEDFLSKVALMTMLDYIREYTYLKIDFARSRALRASVEEEFGENRIVINNELLGVFRFFPMRWGGHRNPNGGDQCQFIHPIYKVLDGRSYIDKKRTTNFFRTPWFPFHDYASVKSLENLQGTSI
jgi:uncharacterized protein (DUF2235 family)